MTREERDFAKSRIEYLLKISSFVFDEHDKEALEAAIQALSQEPTEKPMTVDEMEREYEKSKALFHKIVECDDAVSRDAAIKALSHGEGCRNICANAIIKLPSVTHKSGKWTLMYEPKNMVVCSECGKCAYMYQDKTSAFCPNCGAKMESEAK